MQTLNTLSTLFRSRNFSPTYVEKSTPAWIGHLPFAAWLMLEHAPRIAVELGTHFGNSYFTMCQAVGQYGLPTRCFAVDSWQGDSHAGEYQSSVYETVRAYNEKNYGHFSKLLRMKFHDALSEFEPGSIDLLHIDGLHTYDAVKDDFETWLPKMSERGLVLFHDTSVEGSGFGVARFWLDLKARYACHMEFDHNFGLGVLWPRENIRQCPHHWLEPSGVPQKVVSRVFSTRGIKLAIAYKQKKTVS